MVEKNFLKDIEEVDNSEILLLILATVPALISYIDHEQRYRYVNRAWEDWFNLKRENWYQQEVRDVLGPRAHARAEPYFLKALEGTPQAFDNEILRRDGRTCYLQIRCVPIRARDGRIQGLVNIGYDTTEAHLAQKRSEETQNFLNAVLNSVTHGVWGVDFAGRVTFINRAAVQLLGFQDTKELLGQPIHAMVHHTHPTGEPYALEECPIHRSAVLGESHRVSHEVFYKKDGSPIPVAYSSAPIFEQDRCIGSVASFENLSAQLQMQNQIEVERVRSIHREKLAALGEVAAGIAHEINNPLAILAGGLQMIPQYIQQPEVLDKKLAVLQRSVERISRIVLGLKKYSRAGNPDDHELLSLKNIVLESQPLFEVKSKSAGVEVVLNLASDQQILGNAMELEQVMLNLVYNAVDAVKDLPEKWVRVDLSNRGREVVLRVIDSGPMISEALEQKIFQPFFTTKPIGEGVGLGLSILKGILDQHHAKIRLDRSQSTTCFELLFSAANSGGRRI